MPPLFEPEHPCGNFPTRECPPPPVGDVTFGPCADFCERFPWMLPSNERLADPLPCPRGPMHLHGWDWLEALT